MIARLQCCGGQFGMDDLAMMLTMVRVLGFKQLRRANTVSHWSFLFLACRSSVCSPYSPFSSNMYPLTMISGQFWSWKRHMDSVARQYHKCPPCEFPQLQYHGKF
jgi:hypothetical protein